MRFVTVTLLGQSEQRNREQLHVSYKIPLLSAGFWPLAFTCSNQSTESNISKCLPFEFKVTNGLMTKRWSAAVTAASCSSGTECSFSSTSRAGETRGEKTRERRQHRRCDLQNGTPNMSVCVFVLGGVVGTVEAGFCFPLTWVKHQALLMTKKYMEEANTAIPTIPHVTLFRKQEKEDDAPNNKQSSPKHCLNIEWGSSVWC